MKNCLAPFYSATLSCLMAFIVLGCSSRPSLTLHPVAGQILRNGKPVEEARIIFHPQGDLPPGVHSPMASTDANGRFQLTTLKAGDGAPVGAYRVTIELRGKRLVGEETVRDGPNQLPSKYARPDSTPVKHTVTDGENTVPTINLTD